MFTEERSTLPSKARIYLAYVVAVLFLLSLARFFVIPYLGLPANSPIIVQLNAGILPVAAHLLIFPLITALPASEWARAAGYGWLVIDIATDIMALNGVSENIYLTMRYGGHIPAALWIAVVSWTSKHLLLRIIGLLLALNLAVYSLLPHASLIILVPTALLLPIWFFLNARILALREDVRRAYAHTETTKEG